MLALVLNRSSRVIPKTQPGQDLKLPTVTIMGRKSNILLWTDTHQLLISEIKNKFTSCSSELAPQVTPLTNKDISPFQEQPGHHPLSEPTSMRLPEIHCDHITHISGAQSSTTALKINSPPSLKSLPQLQFKCQLLRAKYCWLCKCNPPFLLQQLL